MTTAYRDSLAVGTKLDNYRIIRTLGEGGFGITYLATDLDLNTDVAIKEYMPGRLAVRTQSSLHVSLRTDTYGNDYYFGLDKFLEEARILAQFKEPNIISIRRFFKANNTAYIVMDYEEGQSLRDYLQSNRTKPSETTLRSIAVPILCGLGVIHRRGFLHRDIKPSNIYLRQNGEPVLLDFGSARQSLSDLSCSLTEIVTPGYSPLEQYSARGKQGPWTDLYSMGATLYKCIVGTAPKVSTDRILAIEAGNPDSMVSALELGEGSYSEKFLGAVDWMLKPIARDRPQRVDEVLNLLARDSQAMVSTEIEKMVVFGNFNDSAETDHSRTKFEKIQFSRRAIDRAKPSAENREVVSEQNRSKSNSIYSKWIGAIAFFFLIATAIFWSVREQKNEALSTENPKATQAESKSKQIDLLLVQANKELEAKNLTEPTGVSALDRFRAVLELDPGNFAAVNGIKGVIQSHIAKARSAVLDGRIELAGSFIDRTRWVLSEVSHLKEMSDYIADTDKKLASLEEYGQKKLKGKKKLASKHKPDKKINSLLVKAEQDIQALRLTTPQGQNALERFYLVLDADPDNELAKKGIDRIVERYNQLASNAIIQKQFDQAETYLVKARKVDPNSDRLGRTFDQLGVARKNADDEKLSEDQEIAALKKLEEQKKEQITKLLKLADNDMKALRLTIPKADNALHRYKQLLELEPGNFKAIEAVERITKKTGSLEILGGSDETDLLLNTTRFRAIEFTGSRITLFPGWYYLRLVENDKVLHSERILIKVGELSQVKMNKTKPSEIPSRFDKQKPKRVPLPPP